MKRYKPYIRPYISAFILGPILMITEVLGEIMLPKMMSLIINNGVANRDKAYIIGMGIAMVRRLFQCQGIHQLYQRSAPGAV